jgi:hypothetical protein
VTRRDLLQLVEKAFPFVPRPPESEISFHQDECAHCEMSRKGLMKYPGTATRLPEAAIRFVYDEWTTLSAKAAVWIFPSYLRSVLTNEDEDKDYPPPTTEWLIYSLRPIANEADEIRTRLSLLTPEQVTILLAILEYWRKDASWREYCAEEIDAAIAFMSTIKI